MVDCSAPSVRSALDSSPHARTRVRGAPVQEELTGSGVPAPFAAMGLTYDDVLLGCTAMLDALAR